jgi:hypothetical protein
MAQRRFTHRAIANDLDRQLERLAMRNPLAWRHCNGKSTRIHPQLVEQEVLDVSEATHLKVRVFEKEIAAEPKENRKRSRSCVMRTFLVPERIRYPRQPIAKIDRKQPAAAVPIDVFLRCTDSARRRVETSSGNPEPVVGNLERDFEPWVDDINHPFAPPALLRPLRAYRNFNAFLQ